MKEEREMRGEEKEERKTREGEEMRGRKSKQQLNRSRTSFIRPQSHYKESLLFQDTIGGPIDRIGGGGGGS